MGTGRHAVRTRRNKLPIRPCGAVLQASKGVTRHSERALQECMAHRRESVAGMLLTRRRHVADGSWCVGNVSANSSWRRVADGSPTRH